MKRSKVGGGESGGGGSGGGIFGRWTELLIEVCRVGETNARDN